MKTEFIVYSKGLDTSYPLYLLASDRLQYSIVQLRIYSSADGGIQVALLLLSCSTSCNWNKKYLKKDKYETLKHWLKEILVRKIKLKLR